VHEVLVAIVAGAQPDCTERRQVRREADGKAREYDVKNDGEGKLQTGKHDRIKIHGKLRSNVLKQFNYSRRLQSMGAYCVPTVR
jgi:hypothetical protein